MSIQAATLRTDVEANTDQAAKALVDFDSQLKALAETSHDPVVVTANTTQAQEQIAALGAAGSTTAPVEITPQVDTAAAKAGIDGLADDIKAKLKDNTPEITPKVETSEIRRRLEQLFADIREDVQKTNAELGKFGESLGKIGSAFTNIQSVAGGLSVITDPLLNAASAAEEAYEAHEGLAQSLTSLVAKEDLHTGAAKNMTDALALAGPKAEELLKWNQQLALHSPFDEEGVAQAFRMAQSLGFVSDSSDATVVSAKRLTQTLTDWSTATSVGSEGMQRVTLALGQIQTKGKLAGDEVGQLVEAGVSVDQILSQAFGKSTAEIQQMREKGLIPANDAILAIVQSLEKDYAGAAERSGATMEGLRNSLDDLQKVALREFFTGTFEAIQPQLQKFVDTFNDPAFQKNLHAIGDVLGSDVGDAAKNLSDVAGAIGSIGTTVGAAVGPIVALKDGIVSLADAIPYVDQLSHSLGAEIFQKFSFGGFLIDAPIEAAKGLGTLVGQLNNYLGVTQDTEKAETGAADATKGHTQAHVQLGQAVGLTGDALKKYQEQIAQLGEQGSEAFAKLNQLTADHNEKITQIEREHQASLDKLMDDAANERDDLAADHGAKLAAIAQKAGEDRTKAEEDYHKKLQSLGNTEHKAEEDAAEDHGRKLVEIAQKATDDRTKAEEDLNEKLQAVADKEHEGRLQLEANFAQQLSDMQERADQQRADLAENHGEKRLAIQKKIDALGDGTARDANDKQLVTEQDGYDARLDALEAANQHTRDIDTREWNERLQAMQGGLDKQVEAENKSYDTRLENQQQKAATALEKLQQVYADNQYKLEQIVQTGQERIGDLTADHGEKLADLDQNAKENQSRLTESHEDRMAQFERDKASATSYQQLQRIAEQEALENQMYDRQTKRNAEALAKAQKDENDAYTVKKDRMQRELDEQIAAEKIAAQTRADNAKQSYETEYKGVQQVTDDHNAKLKAIADAGAEAMALAVREHNESLEALDYAYSQNREKLLSDHATKELGIRGQLSDATLAKQRQALQDQLDAEDAAYTKSLGRLDKSSSEQLAHAQREHDDKSVALTTTLNKDTLAANTAYESRLTDIDKATKAAQDKENASYDLRIGKLRENLSESTKAARESYDERLGVIDVALGKAQTKENADYEARLGKLKENLSKRLIAENEHFGDSEKAANDSYAKQQEDQRKHLGKILDDQLKAMETRYPQLASKIEAERKKVQDEYGLVDQAGTKAWADLTKATNDALGIVDPRIEASNRKLGELHERLMQHREAADKAGEGGQHLAEKTDALTKAVDTSSNATDMWTRAWAGIQGIWASIMGMGGGGGGGSWGGGGGGGTWGVPGRASGGPVTAGTLYEVNEGGGHEFFRPNTDGNIIPLSAGGGGGTTIIHQHFYQLSTGAIVQQSELGDFLRQATNEFFRDNPTATGSPH